MEKFGVVEKAPSLSLRSFKRISLRNKKSSWIKSQGSKNQFCCLGISWVIIYLPFEFIMNALYLGKSSNNSSFASKQTSTKQSDALKHMIKMDMCVIEFFLNYNERTHSTTKFKQREIVERAQHQDFIKQVKVILWNQEKLKIQVRETFTRINHKYIEPYIIKMKNLAICSTSKLI